MNPRLKIAAQIFPDLILHDLGHAIEKPHEVAHRALLFADTLLLCDMQSGPIEFGRSHHDAHQQRQALDGETPLRVGTGTAGIGGKQPGH